MSRIQRLQKAVRDRAKRGSQLVALFAKESRAGRWRAVRTEQLERKAKRTKNPTDIAKAKESRRKLEQQRAKLSRLQKMIRASRSKLAHWRSALRREESKGNPGQKAVAFLVKRAGWHESPAGSNDSKFLANWRRALNMAWMRGQPWCGFACLASYHYAAKKDLPKDTVSTVAIANRAHSGNGFRAVGWNSIKTGDLVVFNFGSGIPKHVGLARGPARGGVVLTVEGNTSASNGGSQANGGGIYLRTRSRGLVHTVARPK